VKGQPLIPALRATIQRLRTERNAAVAG
jgi:hypothetical protein